MLINIDIPENAYCVRVGESIKNFGDRLRESTDSSRVFLVTNDKVGPLYKDILYASLENASFGISFTEIEDGEEYKSLDTAVRIYEQMSRERIERFTPVIGFGGGVIGDLAGFVASTYLRGLPFYNIPTSLIAQVDSSIGGKTGVNLKCGKNLVGTFYQPVYVHADVELLNTLDEREYKSGLAEVIKHAVIKGEKFMSYIENNIDAIMKRDLDVLEIMISECVKIKGDVVVKDEKEAGLRRVLNLGHTVGHGLEAAMGYGSIRHGEGVSIGMVAALLIAEKTGQGDSVLTSRIKDMLEKCGLPVKIPASTPLEKVAEAMYLDKKVRGSKLEFVLPLSTGNVVSGVAVEENIVREVMEQISERS
jgi:3-dehydroquinate synthase